MGRPFGSRSTSPPVSCALPSLQFLVPRFDCRFAASCFRKTFPEQPQGKHWLLSHALASLRPLSEIRMQVSRRHGWGSRNRAFPGARTRDTRPLDGGPGTRSIEQLIHCPGVEVEGRSTGRLLNRSTPASNSRFASNTHKVKEGTELQRSYAAQTAASFRIPVE